MLRQIRYKHSDHEKILEIPKNFEVFSFSKYSHFFQKVNKSGKQNSIKNCGSSFLLPAVTVVLLFIAFLFVCKFPNIPFTGFMLPPKRQRIDLICSLQQLQQLQL